MATASRGSEILHFGVFEVDLEAEELRKNGVRVKLQRQPFQVLVCLVEHSGKVVTREELIERLWPNGTVVEYEHSLGTAVNKIRQALGDTADNPRFVKTLPRRGYRFLLPVERIARHAKERPQQAAKLAPQPGGAISHYRITEKLGEGGMGVVYKAEDTKLERPVALKFLAEHAVEDAEHKTRFVREARAAARLDHQNICSVYEIDEAEGQTFLAMAYLEGQTVKDKTAERPLKLDEAVDIAVQTAQGLQAAHEKGIAHRESILLFWRRSQAVGGAGEGDIFYLRKTQDGRYEEVHFLTSEFEESTPQFSPDERFVAYTSDESGRREIYIRSFPDGGAKRVVSVQGGTQPRWRADGKELFYIEGDSLMAVPVATAPSLSVGAPVALFSAPGLRWAQDNFLGYDVTLDGERFVLWEPVESEESDGSPSIRVVQNWFAEFKNREAE